MYIIHSGPVEACRVNKRKKKRTKKERAKPLKRQIKIVNDARMNSMQSISCRDIVIIELVLSHFPREETKQNQKKKKRMTEMKIQPFF